MKQKIKCVHKGCNRKIRDKVNNKCKLHDYYILNNKREVPK